MHYAQIYHLVSRFGKFSHPSLSLGYFFRFLCMTAKRFIHPSYGLGVCPSVRLSVTLCSPIKTAQARIKGTVEIAHSFGPPMHPIW